MTREEISPRKIAPIVRNKTRTKRDDVTKIGQKACVPGRPPRLKVWYPLPFCLAASRTFGLLSRRFYLRANLMGTTKVDPAHYDELSKSKYAQ